MLIEILIALLSITVAALTHLMLLGGASKLVDTYSLSKVPAFLTILYTATLGQCLAALYFAFAYLVSQDMGLGGFDTPAALSFVDIYHFSLVNLTTLGLGDVIPTLHLKFLAGLEAMTGFLLISCSASHVFQIMKRDN